MDTCPGNCYADRYPCSHARFGDLQAGIIAAQNSAYPLQGAPIVALPQAVPAATGHTQLAAPTGAITLVPHPHIPGLQIAVAAGHPAAGVGGDLAAHYVPAALAAQHQAQLAAQYQIQLAAQHQAQLAAQVAQVQVASPHHVVAVNAAGENFCDWSGVAVTAIDRMPSCVTWCMSGVVADAFLWFV